MISMLSSNTRLAQAVLKATRRGSLQTSTSLFFLNSEEGGKILRNVGFYENENYVPIFIFYFYYL